MKLPPDFQATLMEKTDEQLYDMLAQAGDYRPEAIAAAWEEWRRRDLSPERVAQVRAGGELRLAEQAKMAEDQRRCLRGAHLLWELVIKRIIGM